MTLACDGGSLKCHKIVLAASSDYFQKLFIDNNSEHPIVFLKDVQVSQVKAILDYMYRGEVSVAQQELPALLRVAELLRVKGMIEENKEAKVEGEGEKKEVRQGSTDSAPPNSVVPPTSSNGHTTSAPLSPHPPTSRPLVPPPGAIPPNFRPFLTPPGSTSTPPFPMWPLPGLLPGAYNLFNQRDRKDLSPGPKDRHKMASGSSSDKDLPLPPLIPREQGEEREGGAKSAGLNGDGSEDDRTPFPHDPRNPYNNDKSPNSQQQYAGGAGGHGNNGNMKLEGIAGYVPAQRLEWKRYKQYTRNDIMAAIEEVKTGKLEQSPQVKWATFFCLGAVFLSPGGPSRFSATFGADRWPDAFSDPKCRENPTIASHFASTSHFRGLVDFLHFQTAVGYFGQTNDLMVENVGKI